MKQACELLEQISKTSSRTAKIALLKQGSSKEVSTLLDIALNPLLHYGVINFNTEKDYKYTIPTLMEIQCLKTALVNKEVTGNEAKELMRQTLLCTEPVTRKWLVRVFKKNLQAGLAISTANKVFPDLIPTFEIGLCNSFDDSTKTSPAGYVMEPKFDGLRALTFIDAEGKMAFVSRGNKPLYNLGIIEEQLKSLDLKSVLLDGECWAKDWNDSISILHSHGEHSNKKELIYYIFDMLTLDEWKNKKTLKYLERKYRLYEALARKGELPNVKPVRFLTATGFDDFEAKFENFIKEGYEGAVLKKTDSEYPFDRCDDWLKWKKTFDVDIPIVGYEEGTGRNKGRLGAFVCDFNGTKVRIGGGYSDNQRTDFWAIRDYMLGKIIEVKAWEITKHKSLRHPQFVRVREDKEV